MGAISRLWEDTCLEFEPHSKPIEQAKSIMEFHHLRTFETFRQALSQHKCNYPGNGHVQSHYSIHEIDPTSTAESIACELIAVLGFLP